VGTRQVDDHDADRAQTATTAEGEAATVHEVDAGRHNERCLPADGNAAGVDAGRDRHDLVARCVNLPVDRRAARARVRQVAERVGRGRLVGPDGAGDGTAAADAGTAADVN